MVAQAKEQDTMSNIRQMLSISETGRSTFITRAQTGKDFYENRHWSDAELLVMEKKRITPITINQCFPVINSISGLQRQSRRDIKVRHRKDSSAHLAGVYTELIKHTFDVCYGHYVISETFKRGMISGEDFLKCTIELDESPGGYICIGRRSCFDGFPDPTNRHYDLNKGKYFIEREWVLKEEIAALYPDKAKGLGDAGTIEDSGDQDLDRIMGDLYGEEENIEADEINFKKLRYRVYTIWWKEITPAVQWTDTQAGTVQTVTGKDMAKAKRSAKGSEQFHVKPAMKTVLHKTCVIGDVMLMDEVDPFGKDINFIPFTRFSPYFEDGYVFGVLENLQGPQREVNINRTQATRIMQQTANSGWIVDKILDPAKERILKIFGSIPGIVLQKRDYGGSIEKIEPNQLSTGHIALAERSVNDVKEISLVNDQMRGVDTGRAESGRAIALKQRQGQQGIEPMLDNLDWSLKLLGSMIVEYVRKTDVYTDDEVKKTIDESKLIDPEVMAEAEKRFRISPDIQQPNAELMAIMTPQDQDKIMSKHNEYAGKLEDNWGEVVRLEAIDMFLEQMRSDDKGVYGIKIGLSPEAPTIKMANQVTMSEIANAYPGRIPIEVFIKNSGMTNKDEVAAQVQQADEARMMALQQSSVSVNKSV